MWWLLSCADEPGRVPPAPADPADPAEAVEVTVEVAAPSAHRIDVTVLASEPAAIAVACTRADDPAEVHLVESPAALEHRLPIGGLRAETDYDCVAAALGPPGPPAAASVSTPAAVAGQVTASVERHPTLAPTGAYTLANVQRDCVGGVEMAQYLVMFDLDGEVRWREDLPAGMNFGIEARYHGDGEIVWGGGGVYGIGAPAALDVFDGPLGPLPFDGSDGILFHHDGKVAHDGRTLTTEITLDTGWMDFQIRLTDPATGATDWLFDSDEWVAQGFLSPGDATTNPDPYHLNHADLVETDDGPVVVASLCTAYEVVAIDVATHAPRWRLGANGDLAAPAGELPECTHGLEYDGQHLLVYDNGHQRGWSRAAEWTIGEGVATLDWTWSEPGWFEISLGDVDWLGEDRERVLITQAHGECLSPSPGRPNQVVEVDTASGEVVHRLVFEDPLDSGYRSERVDGCDVFADVRTCAARAERWEEVRSALGQ